MGKNKIDEFDKKKLLQAKRLINEVYNANYDEPSRLCNRLSRIMGEIEETLNKYNECYRITGR